MENRHEKFVFKEETFEDSKETSQELMDATKANVYSKSYMNPPILKGYKYVCGEWNNGFVIERNSDGGQFVWIPAGSLDSNGTFSMLQKRESIKENGGFYLSRYKISENPEGKPQSVKGARPWKNINIQEAMSIAESFEENELVKSHLTIGTEYDSVFEWIIKSGIRTRREIAGNSPEQVSYWNTNKSPRALFRTGSREEWCTNNIYDLDFVASVQEQNASSCMHVNIEDFTDFLSYYDPFDDFIYSGFRITLCIK